MTNNIKNKRRIKHWVGSIDNDEEIKSVYERAHELFKYNDGQLIRKVDKGRAHAGDIVGSPVRGGYLQVKFDKRLYLVHRLIYLMYHSYFPKYLDHIDGDVLNNRIKNLRAASYPQNNANSRLRHDNSSGVKGVYWSREDGKWRGQIRLNGETYYAGYHKTIQSAERAVRELRERMHGDFCNHGDTK